MIEAGWSSLPQPRNVSDGTIRQMLLNIREQLIDAGIPVEITTRRQSLVWSCTPITVEGRHPVMVTDAWMSDLRKALEPCKDAALVERIWSPIGG